MNEHSRNRLVGAMILASLAAIFLPMLFDGAGIERRSVPAMPGAATPAPTVVEPLDETDPEWAFLQEVRQRRADATGGGVVGLPRHEPLTPADVEEAVEVGPALATDGTPRAYSVQLGSFTERENAERLRGRLLDDGFEAYVTESREGEQVLHRVAVGPNLDPGAVQRLRDELSERYDLDALVVRFTLARAMEEGEGGSR
jgi:DedD protein